MIERLRLQPAGLAAIGRDGAQPFLQGAEKLILSFHFQPAVSVSQAIRRGPAPLKKARRATLSIRMSLDMGVTLREVFPAWHVSISAAEIVSPGSTTIRLVQTLQEPLSGFGGKTARRERVEIIMRVRRGAVQELQLPLVTLAPDADEMMQPHLEPQRQ